MSAIRPRSKYGEVDVERLLEHNARLVVLPLVQVKERNIVERGGCLAGVEANGLLVDVERLREHLERFRIALLLHQDGCNVVEGTGNLLDIMSKVSLIDRERALEHVERRFVSSLLLVDDCKVVQQRRGIIGARTDGFVDHAHFRQQFDSNIEAAFLREHKGHVRESFSDLHRVDPNGLMIEFKCITEKVERLVVEALAHEDGGAFVKAIGSMLGGSNYSIDYEGLTKELESVVESALMQIDRSHVVDGAGNLLGTEYSSTMEEVERLIEVNKGRVELTRSLEPHAIEEQYVGFVARSKLERIDFLHGVGRERAIGEQLLLVRPEDLLQEPEVLEVRIERHDRLPESMSIEHEPQAQRLALVDVN